MPRGDQLIRQWRIIRLLACCRYGKTAAEIAYAVEAHVRTVYRDLEVIQGAGFPLYTVKINGKSFWRFIQKEEVVTRLETTMNCYLQENATSYCINS